MIWELHGQDLQVAETLGTDNEIVVASGENFPDALSCSVLASNLNSPIILTDSTLPNDTSDYLKEQNSERISLLGGTGAISKDVENSLQSAVNYSAIARVDDNNLFKSNLDGSEQTKLTTEGASPFLVVDHWIYASNRKNEFYKMNTDGSNKVLLGTEFAYNMLIDGNYLYYQNGSDGDSIYKMDINTNSKTKIIDSKVSSMNIIDGWIYYSNFNDGKKLYKIKTDGTENTKLSEDSTSYLTVYNGWIYYSNDSDSQKLYRIRTDGTDRVKFVDESCGVITALGDYIIYSTTVSPFIGKIAQIDGRAAGRFAIPDVFDQEPNDSIESAITFSAGGGWSSPNDNAPSVYGSLQSNDSDFYKISLSNELNFNLIFNSFDILNNAVISVMDNSGKIIYSTQTELDGYVELSVKLAAGTYYIKVSALNGSIIESGSYKLDGWYTSN